MANKLISLIALIFVSACSALQQAPLVYSSKVSLGVDISATSTETPGISLTLGYKQVDAAYVPVAVAKKCETETNCTDAIYKLVSIRGESDVGGKINSSPSHVEAEKARKDYEQAVVDANNAKNIHEAAKATMAQLNTRKAELEADKSKNSTQSEISSGLQRTISSLEEKRAVGTIITADEDIELGKLKATLQAMQIPQFTMEQKNELTEIPSKIVDAQNNLTSTLIAYNDKKIALEKLAPEAKLAEQQNNLTRKDAYSVYGRFEADTNVKTNAASVGLGKVFSTGVASQNLAQGLGDYYKNLGIAACYDAIARLKTDKSTPEEVAQWIRDCRSEVKDGL